MTFDFWCRWLLIVSIAMALFGIFVALFPESFLLGMWNHGLAQTFSRGALSHEAAAIRSFLLGPLGATIAGYFVLQAFIIWKPFRRRERWAWWAVTSALLLWFVVDSAQSLRHGAVFNVVMINIPALVVIGLPLVMTIGDFGKRAREDAGRPA